MFQAITLHSTLLGLASWAIPFAASFFFFDRTGHLLIDQPLFKSIMVVVGAASGAALLVYAFKRIAPSVQSGLSLGLYWLAINLVLDLAVLVRLMHMSATLYLADIGLRYLVIPIMSVAMGAVSMRSMARP